MSSLNTSLAEVFLHVIKLLEKEKIQYMIVGSVASIAYGETRLTRDMDLVIDIPAIDLKKFEQIFNLDEYYCPPNEVLRDEFMRRGQFNIIHHQSGLKIDFVFRKASEHAQTEFKRRRQVELWPDFQAFLASPEDVIIKKLEYFKEGQSHKHLIDIKGILSQTEIDFQYLNKWVGTLGLLNEWDQVEKT